MEEVQIKPSGFKRLVQEDLIRRNKVQDEVIDFLIESKEPPREVVARKTVEGREKETIKKAALEYKKAATEYRQRDTTNKEGKGNQEEKKRVEEIRISRLKRIIEVTRIPRIKKTIKVTDIPRIERAIDAIDFLRKKAEVEDRARRKENYLRSTTAKRQQKAVTVTGLEPRTT